MPYAAGIRGEAETAAVWEEIRKALAATGWDGTQQLARYRKYSYQRELTPNRRRVTREDGRVLEGVAGHPYRSLPATQLARDGYVVARAGDTLQFALPDAQVLLTDVFLKWHALLHSTHCFQVVRDAEAHPGDVGLAFRPAADRNMADVRGVMWLDELSADLKRLEVGYTRLLEDLEDDRAGGTVDFLRLPSGTWIVQRWELRTPAKRDVLRDPQLRVGGLRTQVGLAGWRDLGGEVLEVNTADGATLYPANLTHVVGVVFDSTRAAPLSGAVVAIDRTGFSARTDSAGQFHLTAPLEREYSLRVAHPWLDSLGYRTALDSVQLSRGKPARPHARAPAPGRAPRGDRGDRRGRRSPPG